MAAKKKAGESCSYGSIQSVGLSHFGRELEAAGRVDGSGPGPLCDPLE